MNIELFYNFHQTDGSVTKKGEREVGVALDFLFSL